MKLKIEKVDNGVKVELTTDTSKKPASFVLNKAQIKSLNAVLDTAMNAERFMFSIEL